MTANSSPYRSELKYWINHDLRDRLLSRWSPYLTRDPYTDSEAKTPVLSLYYDSPHLDFYREKVEGLAERKKLRLRTYDTQFRIGNKLFWEIKIKRNDHIKKIRFPLEHTSQRDFHLDSISYPNPYVRNKFNYLYDVYNPIPSAKIFYIREAYIGVVESDVRVTIDSHLMALHPEEKLTWQDQHVRRRKILPEDLLILEIKTTKSFPSWIYRSISEFGLQLTSISKYVFGIDKLRSSSARTNSGVFIS